MTVEITEFITNKEINTLMLKGTVGIINTPFDMIHSMRRDGYFDNIPCGIYTITTSLNSQFDWSISSNAAHAVFTDMIIQIHAGDIKTINIISLRDAIAGSVTVDPLPFGTTEIPDGKFDLSDVQSLTQLITHLTNGDEFVYIREKLTFYKFIDNLIENATVSELRRFYPTTINRELSMDPEINKIPV